MLPFLIIILLTLAQNGLMVSKQQSLSHYIPNLISTPQQSPFEMDVPEHLEALGTRLTVRIRLSPHLLLSNLSMSEFPESGIKTREMYLQLGIYERNGDLVMLTQEKLKRTISTNWQEVNFDCGWIVKGGKYSVYLQYYPDGDDDEDEYSSVNPGSIFYQGSGRNPVSSVPHLLPPPHKNGTDRRFIRFHQNQYGVTNNETFSFDSKPLDGLPKPVSDHPYSSSRSRVLAKKTINVKYPTILFEVPTRLETYSTSAPVTFGLTKTICKPKLELPSTLLSLTMCSDATVERSGPSDSHFSPSTAGELRNAEDGNHFHNIHPGGPPIASHHESSHNRDRHHRRYNPDHYSSSFQSWPTQTQKSIKHQNVSEEKSEGGSSTFAEMGNQLECHRDIATIFQEPLLALQTEGRITINVECQFWGRNATYVIQLRETASRFIIAQSPFIKVEWSSQFSLELNKNSILRCQGSIRARVSHPQCILQGRDKIRVYGHETLSVPSLLAPSRISYIGEQQIRNNNRILSFRCTMFPARFLRFCFQYVNTAVDDSVAVVIEKCIPTGPANKISDGGWSAWSKWSSCSVTCGSGGKRFRYRFCDSPPPSSGANFCQGKAIQEEPCDSGIPCPQISLRRQSPGHGSGVARKGIENHSSSSPAGSDPAGGSGELDQIEGKSGGNRKYVTGVTSGSGRPSFMDFSVLNVSTTPGCECGCILYDLIPTKNYSLVIIISANQSSCADEDEEDHHNFRWILHAKNEKDRIQLDIVGMDVQCVTMTFRDGNTTDSNLLEVITASQPSDPIQFEGLYERELGQRSNSRSMYQQQSTYQYDDEDVDDASTEEESDEETGMNGEDDDTLYERSAVEEQVGDENVNTKGSNSILRIESTGASLSIGTTSDSNKNCSGQFIYFIAYYTTIPTLVTGVAERKEEIVGYDFWTFLILKVMVLFFITIVLCSTFGGCVTKVYRKYKYKELKCFENEDEEGSLNDEGNAVRKSRRDTLDDASRCTSITLMSFDYSYWRRLRILRLKYFLLRPRPLDPVTTKTKSFPNTPTVSTKMKENTSTSAGRNNTSKNAGARPNVARGDEPISKIQTCDDDHHNPLLLNKPISLSETNLREKLAVLAVTKNGYELRRTWRRKTKITTGESDCIKDGVDHDDEEQDDGDVTGEVQLGTYSKRRLTSQEHGSVGDVYGGDGNASLASTSISMSQSLNGSETASSNSVMATPTPTPTPTFLEGGRKQGSDQRVRGTDLRSTGIKFLKEKENLKRKAGETKEKLGGCREGASREEIVTTPRSVSSGESSYREALKKRTIRPTEGKGKPRRILKHGDSSASVSTVQSTRTTCDEDSSRVASRADLEDTDQDFEMDYYDYDVMNAGNIPGSYLAMEPAFVLWNSEVYPHSEEGTDGEEDSKGIGAHLAEETQRCMEDSAYGIEMLSSGSSVGMFSGDTSPKKEFGMKETSLDTLKFADDDDDDDLESYAESAESIPIKSLKETTIPSQPNNKYNTTSLSGGLGKS